MKGTRLWQAPGSPIIQGRSRAERPFWQGWVSGAFAAEGTVFVIALVWGLRAPGPSSSAALSAVVWQALVPAIPGSIAGAAVGVWLSRTMGWRRPLLTGAIVGAVCAGITIAVF